MGIDDYQPEVIERLVKNVGNRRFKRGAGMYRGMMTDTVDDLMRVKHPRETLARLWPAPGEFDPGRKLEVAPT